jgi:hypothetical protein
MVIVAAIKEMLNPAKWVRIPSITAAVLHSVQSNIPIWMYPRVVYGTLFSSVFGFNAHTFDRDMVTSWTTDAGAAVLLPNWDKINPLLFQLFHQ